jgi:hypothetical protein
MLPSNNCLTSLASFLRGFRRIDDEERVPKGSIAYSHDFFVQSAIARMRFMKKEEDRKPSAEGEDAKAGEETKAESLSSLLGEPEPQRPEMGNVASPAGLVRSPVTQSGLDLVTRILNAPGAPPSIPLGQQHQQPHYLASQVESQVTNSLLAVANSQLSNFTAAASPAELSSLRNQLTGSLHYQQMLLQERQRQQQLLLQERQQQILLEERQQQLQRLSGTSIGPNQFEQAQGYLGGASRSMFDSARLSLPAGLHSASLGVHADPSLAVAAASYPTASDLALSRMLATTGSAGYVDNFASLRAAGFQPPEVASLNPSPDPDLSRLLLLQRQQNQQVDQERLLQLQQQFNLGQHRAAALQLRPEEGDEARTETKEEHKDGGRR